VGVMGVRERPGFALERGPDRVGILASHEA
jgi:hypothetical protein